ncbi:MAG TPA: oligosaccharide flippase family protein [Kofleriaceae bacterium]|jgi:PST family polysaccharide transporter|nr:oligosaccharide flippase family protein [Kofleriaceae bacterium]
MSLVQKAARGALWTIMSSMGGRVIGVLGTLVMTRFLSPDKIGEVNDASIIALTASWLTTWGFGQYAVVRGRGDDATEVTWHAVVAYAVLGTFSLGLIALFGGRLMPFFEAPDAAAYLPGMALAVYIRRYGAIPERVLNRAMNFRASGVAAVAGELSYTVVALTLASPMFDYGGWAIVVANIVQSVVMVAILIRAAGFASWATPTPLRWARYKDMLRFGVPLGLQSAAHAASRYWDNLAISHFFGTATTGAYNMAYNLADIPAIQVGEQLALVLMPSMASLPPARRPRALERSSALLSLIIFPLAVGLGLIAQPLIALILPANGWQEVAPLLAILACLSVFRPITWVLSAYLEAESKTNRLMFLEFGKIALLLGGIAALHHRGVRAASFAVGIAFGVSAVAGVLLVMREGPSPRRLLIGFLQPLAACGVMAAAAWAVRDGLIAIHLDHPAIVLTSMILTGAGVYVAAAFALCRSTTLDLLDLLKQALRRAPAGAASRPPAPTPGDVDGSDDTAI